MVPCRRSCNGRGASNYSLHIISILSIYIYLIICDVLGMYIMYVQYDSYNNYILILHINIVLMVTSNDKKCVARGH